jgi:hypothetical protein
VIQWHRQGFRLYWHWRSRSGRPSFNREVRYLMRQMSNANPLWGAPRIYGELLKLGIEVSQSTVAKYMMRRQGRPSPTWRNFLRNEAIGIAAIDMFVVAVCDLPAIVCNARPGPRPQEDCSLQCHAAPDCRLVVAPGDRSVSVSVPKT